MGQELIVTATLFRALGDRIENPTYTVWYYPNQPEGNVTPRGERWSSSYFGYQGQAYGDEVIKVYKPGRTVLDGPWLYLEIIGTNELWTRFDGWYYKARKTTRPVLSAGHDDYCQVMGPCSAGQGDCDSDSECQSELTCVEPRRGELRLCGGCGHMCGRRPREHFWERSLRRTITGSRTSDFRMGQCMYRRPKVGLHSPPMSSYSSSRHR